MEQNTKIPLRLHHNAYVVRDQRATRRFYEDIIGIPMVACWTERDEVFGGLRVYCHTFFQLADGGALAFFQFADPADYERFGPQFRATPFIHIALKTTGETQAAIAERLKQAGCEHFVIEHGYCRSLYADRSGRAQSRIHGRPSQGRADQRRAAADDGRRPRAAGCAATIAATTTGAAPSSKRRRRGIMSKVFDHIDDNLARLIGAQRMFFVATAPLDPNGHVNLSPKGLASFRIIDPHTVAYLDLTGSGIETVAHIRENGRIVLMFCTFEGPPKILRLVRPG